MVFSYADVYWLVLAASLPSTAQTGGNVRHGKQLIVTATSGAGRDLQTHFYFVPGEPDDWLQADERVSILDVSRNGLRWTELAFNYRQQYVVFAESVGRTLNILLLPNNVTAVELQHYPLLKTGNADGKQISSVNVDWVSGNIYVCEERGIVYVVKLVLPRSPREAVQIYVSIIYNGAAIPRALVVHPKRGHLYIVMEGQGQASIEQWSMDGQSHLTCVSSGLTNPRALTLDYDSDTLYWVDNLARSRCAIGWYDLADGRQGVISPALSGCVSYGLDFSESYLLLANRQSNSVLIQPALGADPQRRTSIPNLVARPHSLLMYDGDRQPAVQGGCADSNGGCEIFCFNTVNSSRCGCQHGYRLADDDRSCLFDVSVLPQSDFALVTSYAGGTDEMFLVDLKNEITIKLPIKIGGNVTHIQMTNKTVYWSEGSQVKTRDLDVEHEQVVFHNKGVVSTFAIKDHLLYINTESDSSTQIISHNASVADIDHKPYHPEDLALAQHFLYVVLDTTHSRRSALTDRVVRFNLDGRGRKVLIDTPLQVLNLAVDGQGNDLYTVHRSAADGDIIYHYSLSTKELRLLSVMGLNSYVRGQLTVGGDYIYYYSNRERRSLWRRHRESGEESSVASLKIFNFLQGGLYLPSKHLSESPDACATNPCADICVPLSNGYTCLCTSHSKQCQPTGSGGVRGNTTPNNFGKGVETSVAVEETTPYKQVEISDVIVGVTVGVCLAILVVAGVVCFCCMRRVKKQQAQRGQWSSSLTRLDLMSQSSIQSAADRLSSSQSGVGRRSLSLVNTPLPEPPSQHYADNPHPYELIPQTVYNTSDPLFLSTSSISSAVYPHRSPVSDGPPSKVAPRPAVRRMVSDAYMNGPLCTTSAGERQTLAADEYLRPTSISRYYVEVIPNTPVPLPRKCRKVQKGGCALAVQCSSMEDNSNCEGRHAEGNSRLDRQRSSELEDSSSSYPQCIKEMDDDSIYEEVLPHSQTADTP